MEELRHNSHTERSLFSYHIPIKYVTVLFSYKVSPKKVWITIIVAVIHTFFWDTLYVLNKLCIYLNLIPWLSHPSIHCQGRHVLEYLLSSLSDRQPSLHVGTGSHSSWQTLSDQQTQWHDPEWKQFSPRHCWRQELQSQYSGCDESNIFYNFMTQNIILHSNSSHLW